MKRSELGKRIYHESLLPGKFVARSGEILDDYFNKYKFEASPDLLREIAMRMSDLIPEGTQVLAGLEMGGIPLATAMSLHTDLPFALVRKQRKSYGTKNIVEGADVNGKQVLLVEDIASTAGQMVMSAKDVRDEGAVITHAICVINRKKEVPILNLAEVGIALVSLFTMEELEAMR